MNKKEIKIKPKSEPELQWQAPEFEYYEKDVSWYWLSLMVGIILMALAIWQKNFLFVIFIIVAWLVVVGLARRSPSIWNFRIHENGIEISLPKEKGAEKFYPFSEIKGFDIHDVSVGEISVEEKENKYKKLMLKLESKFSPYLKINIPVNKEEEIENFLEKHLPKKEYEESLADSFSRLIRF